MSEKQQQLLHTHHEEKGILQSQADSYKLLTAELKTENRDLKASLVDLQKNHSLNQDQGGYASNDTLVEMKRLVEEYKGQAIKFENRAILAETQN